MPPATRQIRPWDGWLISIRVELGQVGCTGSALVVCKRSRDRNFPLLSGGGWPLREELRRRMDWRRAVRAY